MLHACGATKYHLLLDFLTAGHDTPAVLVLCPVSTVARSSYAPRLVPTVLEGIAGTLGGKPGGEKGMIEKCFATVSSVVLA